MKPCCQDEARRNVKKARAVAVCDGCGALVLGYGNEADFQSTVRELEESGTPFEHGKVGKLWVIAKRRRGG